MGGIGGGEVAEGEFFLDFGPEGVEEGIGELFMMAAEG